MAVAERPLAISDATEVALEHMRGLVADGIPRGDAARATAQWCRERSLVMDLVDTVLVAGFVALSADRAHKGRQRYQRAANADEAGPVRLVSLDAADALSAADLVLRAPARLDWLEIPYLCDGVEVALGDMTDEQLDSVQQTYLSQAKGKMRHVAFLGEIKKAKKDKAPVARGARVRDALNAQEVCEIGRKWLSTDHLAEVLRAVHEAADAR